MTSVYWGCFVYDSVETIEKKKKKTYELKLDFFWKIKFWEVKNIVQNQVKRMDCNDKWTIVHLN